MIKAIVVLLFGLLIGHRTLHLFFQKKMIDKVVYTKWKFPIQLLIIGVSICFYQHSFFLWIFFGTISFFPYISLVLIELQRKINFEKHVLNFLDQVILSMKSGRSFRDSLLIVVPYFQGQTGFYFKELISLTLYKGLSKATFRGLYQEVLSEFKKITEMNFKSIERLEALRRKIKIEQEFRRKSGKAMAQAKAQSLVLSILYFALMIFICFQYPFNKILFVISLSLFLFLLGLYWMIFLARSFRWRA